MFAFFRTLIYATLFLGCFLLYFPSRLLTWSGIHRPAEMGGAQLAALIVGSLGACIVLACVAAFIELGKGTPAPFDPPRRLVIRGPYRFVRNPMYIGLAFILAAIAIFYHSVWIGVYGAALLAAAILFVFTYEEPILRQKFGAEYETYCRHVARWWPALHPPK